MSLCNFTTKLRGEIYHNHRLSHIIWTLFEVVNFCTFTTTRRQIFYTEFTAWFRKFHRIQRLSYKVFRIHRRISCIFLALNDGEPRPGTSTPQNYSVDELKFLYTLFIIVFFWRRRSINSTKNPRIRNLLISLIWVETRFYHVCIYVCGFREKKERNFWRHLL